MADSIEQFSFQLTASALAEQERALAGLRAGAGIVLAAASIAGSFVGVTISHGSLDLWGIAAMIAFALSVGSALWVLLPHEFVFAFRGDALVAEGANRNAPDMTVAYRIAGIWMEPRLEANRDKIAKLSGWLASSCALLALEVVLWTVSLTS
jgi:hypothetical protein